MLWIVYIVWILIGFLSIWFSYNWHGRWLNYRKDHEIPMIPASILTLCSAGVLWPLVVLVMNLDSISERKVHPLQALNKPMKYIVEEIKNPRENV